MVSVIDRIQCNNIDDICDCSYVLFLQDAVCIRERINRAISVEQHQIEMDKRLNKLKQSVVVNVTRDPNRLLKPTAGWEERKKASNDHYEHTGSVLHVPRRYITYLRSHYMHE